MKTGILVTVIVVLVLALGIQTGFLIKTHLDFKKKQSETDTFERPYAAKVMPNVYAGWGQGSPVIFQRDIDTWDPFEEMEGMQQTMNRLFHDSFSRGLRGRGDLAGSPYPSGHHALSYNPDVDTNETAKEYVMRVDLPGIERDRINVKVENNQIIISGERETEKEESKKGSGFYRSERSFGSFLRSIPLPADADVNGMTAESMKGVLTIRIPKLAASQAAPKKINIS